LHTIGGALGALFAGGFREKPASKWTFDEAIDIPEDFAGDFKHPRGAARQPTYPSSQSIFWRSFLVTVLLTTIVVFSVSNRTTSEAMFILFALIAMAGPLFLLGACFLMMGWLLFRTDLPPEARYWFYLGRITFFIIIGSLVGLAVMVVPFVLLSR
jgi:hypothetical protein